MIPDEFQRMLEAAKRDNLPYLADMAAVHIATLNERVARLENLVKAVAPAVAVLSRAPEVAPEIRAELAEVEQAILALGQST